MMRMFSGPPSNGDSAWVCCMGETAGRVGEAWESRETVLAWLVCEVTDGDAASLVRATPRGTKPVSWSSTGREVSTFVSLLHGKVQRMTHPSSRELVFRQLLACTASHLHTESSEFHLLSW